MQPHPRSQHSATPAFARPRTALALALVSLATACSVGPDYEKPKPTEPIPVAYTDPGPWKKAAPRDHLPKGRWWASYKDTTLDKLILQASDITDGKGNPAILSALARLEEARALAGLDRAALYPGLDAGASAERLRSSGPPSYTANNFSLGFDLRYEIDLWGRVRRLNEAAAARAASSEADYHNVLLSIQTATARAYFELRTLDAERALLRRYIESLNKSHNIVKRRKALGAGDNLDLALAETELYTAESDLLEIDRLRAQNRNALAVLCGKNPSTFAIAEDPSVALLAPPEIPICLPSELLERRPDIAAAERELAATTADVGVATAAFYPSVSLFGSVGFSSVDFDKLLDWDRRYWSLGPSVTLPIFDGGRNTANLRRAKARCDIALSDFRSKVLTAFQEVETCLGDLRLLAARGVKLDQAAASSRQATKLVNVRHEGGAVSYMDVTVAERRAISNERLAIQIRGQQLTTSVLLVKAIGGGFEN
jgi:multidrug efflux system outer membrane protein